MDYSRAAAIVETGIRAAVDAGVPSSIAVVDAGRNLVAFGRCDGAILASVEVAQAKAYTAASLQMSTADLGPAVQPGGPFYGLIGTHGQAFIPFGGGVPLLVDGQLVGAVGAAGGSPDQDAAVAVAAAASLEG